MRVGLLIYGSLATVSGGYLYDRMLVGHLRRAGHTVEIISLPWRSYLQHLGDNLSLPLLQSLQTLEVDVLLQDELNHPSLVLVNRLLRYTPGMDAICRARTRTAPFPIISIVHHLRSDEPHPPLLRKLYRRVEAAYLRSVDAFICNSYTTQRRVRCVAHRGGMPNEPQHSLVAYPAADHIEPPPAQEILAQLAARTMDDGPLRILFVGNLIPRKGLHTLLEACAGLPPADWQLRVVGSLTTDPAYTRTVRIIVQEHGMEAQVTLAGSLSSEQLRRALCTSHLLAVPSFEGFGIVYLEAMAYGLPVIATTAGAAREVVTVGETGYLIEPGDAATLAEHLRHLHKNRIHLAAMSVAARRRYDSHVTWQESANDIIRWLQTWINA